MLDIQNILLVITSILNLVLGIFIYFKNRKDQINISFAAFTFFASLWALSIFFFQIVDNFLIAIYLMKFSYISALFIGVSFYYFSVVFPENIFSSRIHKFFLFILTLIIFLLLLLPNFLIRNIIYHSSDKEIILGKIEYWFFFFIFIGFFIGGLIRGWLKYIKNSGILKKQLFYIVIGVSIGGFFGMLFNLFLPSPFLKNWELIWLGPLFSLIMVISITYAILKHHLMNIKVIGAEIFTGVILLILFAQIFLSASPTEVLLRILFFIVAAFFGYILIRGVIKEVEQKEKISELAYKLEKTNEKLRILDRTKSEFLSLASHQLRTPLSYLKGTLSMLLENFYGGLNEKQKENISRCYESNERLIRLVDDLLNVSRIELGTMKFDFAPANLEEIVSPVIEELKGDAKKKGLYLKFEKPQESLPQVSVDNLKIRQAIQNLIDNAIKYTQKGGINVGLKKEDSKIVFSVKDTGIGLSPEQIKKLFEKFQRGEGAQKLSPQGTGLGLYLAKKLVEAHKGKIWAESEGEGKGSAFYFSLSC